MATVQCSKCTTERKGFRRELDSWRHKLIHCVGFESILEGIYGPLLLRDISLFDDCEPQELDDWSAEARCLQCSFCNLPLDKLSDHVLAATSPLSSPSDYSPCQAPTISESSQSAHKFLQAVFHKKDVPRGCNSNIPLVAQELMKKMIHQFAIEYASKCLLPTSSGVTSTTSSLLSETSDSPLDLTVSRTQEEKESECKPRRGWHCKLEADGVLDLSNRNSAFSTSSSSSSNHKASGSLLPSFTEEMQDLGRQGIKCRQSTALDEALSSLCPSHRSLLYQILKLAHQENVLSFLNHRPVGQTKSHCCHCGVNLQDNVNPNAVRFGECKSHDSNPYFPSIDCDHQDHGITMYRPRDSKSNCSIHHYPLKDCKNKAPQGSSCCCLQKCRLETYTVLSPKRLHCQSLTGKCTCSFASSPSLSISPPLCTAFSSLCPSSSIYCNQHNPHSCPCYSNHACLTQVMTTKENGVEAGDPPCPVLKREQSPSPPSLSPIPSDINKKTDEKPPSLLHHRQEEEDDLISKAGHVNTNHQESDVNAATEEMQGCQAEQNPSGTSLQEVVNRFSEKLETIRPIEKDPPLASTAVNATEKEQQQSPSTSQNLLFHADDHLAEIITTVLHTGSASDYNLSELFNRHDSKEPKSPNTRSRRRQEVLAAMATPTDDSSTRRHTLKIKRELAMFDQSYSRRRGPLAKRAIFKDKSVTLMTSHTLSDSNLVKGESEKEIEVGAEPEENQRVKEVPRNILIEKSEGNKVKDDIQTLVVTEEVQVIKAEDKEREIPSEEKRITVSSIQIPTPELQSIYSKLDSNCDSAQTKVMKVTAASAKQHGSRSKEEEGSGAENDSYQEEAPLGQSSDSDNRPGKDCHRPIRGRQKSQSHFPKGARKSRRSIVPPQRFSSYVTEPRKMFFVACFSESIFNQRTHKDDVSTSSSVESLSKDPNVTYAHLESTSEASLSSPGNTWNHLTNTENDLFTNQIFPQTAAKENSPKNHCSDNRTDGRDCFGRLRPAPKRLQDSRTASRTPKTRSNVDRTKSATCAEKPTNSQIQYNSPIKIMFVSPVKDKEGVRYSLKSAGYGSSGQAEEPFDPCEESSWSGALKKNERQGTDIGTSQVKSISSPLKSTSTARSASLPPKSASSPTKSASSPSKSAPLRPKSAPLRPKSVYLPSKSSSPSKYASSPSKFASSPKSISSSPRIGSRRSDGGTPTKRLAETESQKSPVDLLSFHETTPKRRPGRPKKLGPQLEQKVKRPIGRPRKQKATDSVMGDKSVSGTSVLSSDIEENVNKNLKITVVYGRSRRNKRTVSEGFDQLQTEFHDAWQAVGLQSDWGILMHHSKTGSGNDETAPTELSEELNCVCPVKESAPQSSSNIKCPRQDDAVPSRKPGRPAKVKISGISVTVTTVSPRQRKIQMNKDSLQSPETLIHKKALLPEFKSAKEPWTISCQSTSKSSQTAEGIGTKDESKDKLPNQTVAVRQSVRVKKPSIHFLHAVATSRSYCHSNALLRRSKQLLLNKANNKRRQGVQQSSVEMSGEKRQLCGQERKNTSQDLSGVARVSVDSIFSPEETLRWWAASAEEKTTTEEHARRIRLISDTWVSDTVENQEKEIPFSSELDTRNSSFTRKEKPPSMVRTLFDCPPDKPRSCSMQQLCSWFMQTTETQSLAIVKKTSSRNPYELMHFPRTAYRKSVCHSPQAERLRKHVKKFAKTVPKSPLQHQQAQKRLRKINNAHLPKRNFRRQLFTPGSVTSRRNQGAQLRRSRAFGKYRDTLLRAQTRFLTRKNREGWKKRQRNEKNIAATNLSKRHVVTGLQPKCKESLKSAKDQLLHRLDKSSASSSVDQTQESLDVPKEKNLCSKAWSPETLKECRVFLRKINSPDNESAEEEWDSCTVTLDDGSPSAYLFAGRERELVRVVKAVKNERKRGTSRTASRELVGSAPKSVQEQDEMPVGRQKRNYKGSGVVSTEPPPAKMLRQSRMRGLTGPRWSDFVFEN